METEISITTPLPLTPYTPDKWVALALSGFWISVMVKTKGVSSQALSCKSGWECFLAFRQLGSDGSFIALSQLHIRILMLDEINAPEALLYFMTTIFHSRDIPLSTVER